jgi:altronate hydrolase
VLVLGLGRESNPIHGLVAQDGLQEGAHLVTFSVQDSGGTAKTVARGVERIRQMLPDAAGCEPRDTRAGARRPPDRGPAVRRQRRPCGHQCQRGVGHRGQPPGAPRRHRDPQRGAWDPRRRTPADAACRIVQGALAKSGTARLLDVYRCAERLSARGLVDMDAPGYDPVSATRKVAGGANLICFTTGRGSAYSCALAASLKALHRTTLRLPAGSHRQRLT